MAVGKDYKGIIPIKFEGIHAAIGLDTDCIDKKPASTEDLFYVDLEFLLPSAVKNDDSGTHELYIPQKSNCYGYKAVKVDGKRPEY